MTSYKKLLQEFVAEKYNKTGDERSKMGQEFIPASPTAKTCSELIHEECKEVLTALNFEDLHQVRKELCDLIYVAFYAAAVYNLPIEEDFKLVHANNMLKFMTGSLNKETGKWTKHPNHPKVKLLDIPRIKDFEV